MHQQELCVGRNIRSRQPRHRTWQDPAQQRRGPVLGPAGIGFAGDCRACRQGEPILDRVYHIDPAMNLEENCVA